jgi:hypothetical protein
VPVWSEDFIWNNIEGRMGKPSLSKKKRKKEGKVLLG